MGHVPFTHVVIDGAATSGHGLGPLAVVPSRQRQGIGVRLVRHGHERVRRTDRAFALVYRRDFDAAM